MEVCMLVRKHDVFYNTGYENNLSKSLELLERLTTISRQF